LFEIKVKVDDTYMLAAVVDEAQARLPVVAHPSTAMKASR
jgi:hypothetical protein